MKNLDLTNLDFPREYFSVRATLECGQIFRFSRGVLDGKEGCFVFSADKACFIHEDKERVFLTCEDKDADYFFRFFDLDRDYAAVVARAEALSVPYLSAAARFGKGIRILRQDKAECLISFIVSQQNNIPRIKGILNRLCEALGERKNFAGREYSAFPSPAALAAEDEAFYRALGLGYRAKYVAATAKRVAEEGFSNLENKRGKELKNALVAYTGVGEKVADCVALFAFGDTAAFPVDTWIARLYRENFGGKETDRAKINAFFREKFGNDGGIFQQYLFYYKRENG